MSVPAPEDRAVDWPHRFPHSADEIAREAKRFRELSAEEKLDELMRVIAEWNRQIQESPNRDAILAEVEASERAWQEAHRRIFEQHGV
jgi:hypothetical protein